LGGEKRMGNGSKTHGKTDLVGVFYGALSFTVWGFLPIYWKLLKEIPSGEILAHRIFWSFIFVFGILAFKGSLGAIKETVKSRKTVANLLLSAIFITANWGLYIWAVNSDHMVEASMGYYINPLMVVALGMTVLKERLNAMQYLSIAFAAVGVIIITVQYGRIPWASILLALTFALYGLFKKLTKAEAMVGLAMETAIITPFALGYIVFKLMNGTSGIYAVSLSTIIILLFSGILTATPLLWYGMGAKRVKLSTVGLLQYISPTISLFLGVFVYGEQFTKAHLLSFGFIWIGLVIYTFSNLNFAGRAVAVPPKSEAAGDN
jgi:chloramphenicol-sensitive protein RarD